MHNSQALTLLSILLTAKDTLGAAVPKIVAPRDGPAAFGVFEKRANSSCQFNSIINEFGPIAAEVTSLCSSFLRPTVTGTSTAHETVTSFTTTTTVNVISATQTSTAISIFPEYCSSATPPPNQVCGRPARFLPPYLIGEVTTGVSALQCHQNCLKDPSCLSFQISTGAPNYCELLSANTVTASNALDGPYVFYDRDCPDFLPTGCSSNGTVTKRQNPFGGNPVGGNPYGGNPVGGNPFGGIPAGGNPVGSNPFGGAFGGYEASAISQACSCLITAAPPATTSYVLGSGIVRVNATVTLSKNSTSFNIAKTTSTITTYITDTVVQPTPNTTSTSIVLTSTVSPSTTSTSIVSTSILSSNTASRSIVSTSTVLPSTVSRSIASTSTVSRSTTSTRVTSVSSSSIRSTRTISSTLTR